MVPDWRSKSACTKCACSGGTCIRDAYVKSACYTKGICVEGSYIGSACIGNIYAGGAYIWTFCIRVVLVKFVYSIRGTCVKGAYYTNNSYF